MKKSLLIIGIGAAFLAVSLWVWLSAGKSAKAVRAKFRLGGTLLTLTGMMALGGCSPSEVSCYDPAPPVECYDPAPVNEIYIDNYNVNNALQVSNGDTVAINAYYITFPKLLVTLFDSGSMVIQEQEFDAENIENAIIPFTIDVANYLGEAEMVISGIDADGNEQVLRIFNLEIVAGDAE